MDLNSSSEILFPTFDSIPRLPFDDPKALEYMKNEFPVILTGSKLVASALEKWTMEYLSENIHDKENHVYISKGKHFMYYDDAKMTGHYEFIPETQLLKMSFKQFADLLKSSEQQLKMSPQQLNEKNDNSSDLNSRNGDESSSLCVPRYYLQQSLHLEGVDSNILEDFKSFDWNWIYTLQRTLGMGPIKNNTLWVGMEGVVTPCHFDEAFNFFAQIYGKKKFILFSPEHFPNLYPFPYHHPCDRQCQVDIEHPDFDRFPNFKRAHGLEGIVGPGDVLFLPPYWFHHVISLERTISCNFWFIMLNDVKADIEFPIKKQSQIMALRRNIERFIGDAMGPNQVGNFLNELYSGRFYPPVNLSAARPRKFP